MWLAKENVDKKDWTNALIAVAIDKDKGSQYAMKWALDHILSKGQTVVLIHVKSTKPATSSSSLFPTAAGALFQANNSFGRSTQNEAPTKDMFLPFRCFCTRKDVQCKDLILEEPDVAKALIEWVSHNGADMLIMGAPRGGFLRFGKTDIPSMVTKGAPEFCTIYVISKGKISSTRSASRAPPMSDLRNEILTSLYQSVISASPPSSLRSGGSRLTSDNLSQRTSTDTEESSDFRSPFTRGKYPYIKSYAELAGDTDISFVSNSRPSTERISIGNVSSPAAADLSNSNRCSVSTGGRQSNCSTDFSDIEYQYYNNTSSSSNTSDFFSSSTGHKSNDNATQYSFNPSEFSFNPSDDSSTGSSSSPYKLSDDMEAEMKRLRGELKQTMNMYSNAHQEALTAKRKALELRKWKLEEKKRLDEARIAEQTSAAAAAFLASDTTATEKKENNTKSKAEVEAAERIADLEAQKRIPVEMEALKGTTTTASNDDDDHDHETTTTTSDNHESTSTITTTSWRQSGSLKVTNYHKYRIEEIESATGFFSQELKIGEGGYGPVYKGTLDQKPVAIKVLRPDAAQGRTQFQQEVEILSCIRHPNMVVLLGACPEYGCLVYEYMDNGSLEERLFCKNDTPPLTWQNRFRIAAEIATGLLFLHQMKPEPLVHRDLKPGNILLDRNFVSKICDVGLARLVPPSVADDVTQYRMTAAAGTFCYIDPEYQHTGMLGVKSDVYSLGVLLVQIITAKPPMGLTHQVLKQIENGSFQSVLDPNVMDWPVQEAMDFARIALRCAELRRKDRPDLGSVVMPELNRLRVFAEQSCAKDESCDDDGESCDEDDDDDDIW